MSCHWFLAIYSSKRNMIQKLYFLKFITIEPILFLYFIGFYNLINVGENFRLERYCRVSLDRGKDCDNLGDGTDEDLEVAVQKLENQFLVYESYITVVLPVLLLMFIASWSDKHGRLVPMVMALGGWILSCIVSLLTVLFPSWSANVLLLAAFLRSMGGWQWVLLMASYAYIADITTESNRTTRMTIVMTVEAFGMSAGTALGPIIRDLLGYAVVFLVSIILFTICIIWSYFIIPHRPYKPEHPTRIKSTSERIMTIPRKMKQNLFDLIATSVRRREGYSRFLLNYLILLMLFFINSYPKKMFLWARIVLKWDIDTYSIYSVTDQLLCPVATFLLTPLIKYSNFHDCVTGAIFQLTLFCKTLAYGLLTKPSQWYVVYMFTIVPQWIPMVCIRSLLSKQCDSNEIGRVFSLLAICQCIWGVVENSLYGAVYAATVDTYPSTIHLVESCHSVVVFASFLWIHFFLHGKNNKTTTCSNMCSTHGRECRECVSEDSEYSHLLP